MSTHGAHTLTQLPNPLQPTDHPLPQPISSLQPTDHPPPASLQSRHGLHTERPGQATPHLSGCLLLCGPGLLCGGHAPGEAGGGPLQFGGGVL